MWDFFSQGHVICACAVHTAAGPTSVHFKSTGYAWAMTVYPVGFATAKRLLVCTRTPVLCVSLSDNHWVIITVTFRTPKLSPDLCQESEWAHPRLAWWGPAEELRFQRPRFLLLSSEGCRAADKCCSSIKKKKSCLMEILLSVKDGHDSDTR